ncbi:hypothetical protein K435DRAFT_822915 [Dendrothele bispora CBS 962.96]|uniref:MYND-type domain-containing protein n=1 Tax=Dendrothele bispora (strain CBS 962.96) TaxID=1314807 RepID=A0A4S8L527_DENBC|nr:hypothetical protein K435DRAFT_822915 [Dendrothele bispora CBS 962.96]
MSQLLFHKQSRECQRKDWPRHKPLCNTAKRDNERLSAASGLSQPLSDFHGWIDYYDTVLKNCATISSRFTFVTHTTWNYLPVHQRFVVEKIDAMREANAERGRIEFGNDYYGTRTYNVIATFKPGNFLGTTFCPKQFAIDKRTAKVGVVREDWWILFREYVSAGQKMKFCCGKLNIPGVTDDLCCCGGWTHDQGKKVRL